MHKLKRLFFEIRDVQRNYIKARGKKFLKEKEELGKKFKKLFISRANITIRFRDILKLETTWSPLFETYLLSEQFEPIIGHIVKPYCFVTENRELESFFINRIMARDEMIGLIWGKGEKHE